MSYVRGMCELCERVCKLFGSYMLVICQLCDSYVQVMCELCVSYV